MNKEDKMIENITVDGLGILTVVIVVCFAFALAYHGLVWLYSGLNDNRAPITILCWTGIVFVAICLACLAAFYCTT